jgi:hypothetical protein
LSWIQVFCTDAAPFMAPTGPLKRTKALLVAAYVAAALPGMALGCGYHAGFAVGLTTVHPASIPVALAVHDGVNSGRLPRLSDAPAPLALMRATGAMRGLSEALSTNAADLPPVALVLVEAHLWGRITSAPGGTRLEAHVNGPTGGDVILVTGETALRALVDGRMNWEAANASGLVIIDGPAEGREQLARLLAQRFK